MKNEIQVYDFNENAVRTIDRDGETWWIAKDVCDILGLVNSRKAISSLDEDEKNTVTFSDGTPGNPTHSIISESGLYSLILRSNKPEAKTFKRWVTHEVLPSIRRTGSYAVNQLDAQKMLAENLRLQARLDVTEDERNLYRMKSQILEECSDSDPLTYDDVASMLVEHMKPPFGPKHLKQWLAKHGILTSANHKNDQPVRKYINAGWFVTKVHHYRRNGRQVCEVRYLISWFGFNNMLDLAIREKLIIPQVENDQRLLFSYEKPLALSK